MEERIDANRKYISTNFRDANNHIISYRNAIEIVNQVEQEYKPKTNADRIRAMSDEELANEMLKFPDVCEKIGFCNNEQLCYDALDSGELIEKEMCKRRLMNWLQKETDA